MSSSTSSSSTAAADHTTDAADAAAADAAADADVAADQHVMTLEVPNTIELIDKVLVRLGLHLGKGAYRKDPKTLSDDPERNKILMDYVKKLRYEKDRLITKRVNVQRNEAKKQRVIDQARMDASEAQLCMFEERIVPTSNDDIVMMLRLLGQDAGIGKRVSKSLTPEDLKYVKQLRDQKTLQSSRASRERQQLSMEEERREAVRAYDRARHAKKMEQLRSDPEAYARFREQRGRNEKRYRSSDRGKMVSVAYEQQRERDHYREYWDNPQYHRNKAMRHYVTHRNDIGQDGRRAANALLGRRRREQESPEETEERKRRRKEDAVYVFNTLKRSARDRRLECAVTLNQVEHMLTCVCFYCGKNKPSSFDRLDPDIGYVDGNIEPCCATCNMMKSNMKLEYFKARCNALHLYMQNQRYGLPLSLRVISNYPTEQNAYQMYVTSARRRRIAFGLTLVQFCHYYDGTCVYCGTHHCHGVDRIDSNKGYVEDNVQPCCKGCNYMKNRFDHEVFMEQLDNIVRKHPSNPAIYRGPSWNPISLDRSNPMSEEDYALYKERHLITWRRCDVCGINRKKRYFVDDSAVCDVCIRRHHKDVEEDNVEEYDLHPHYNEEDEEWELHPRSKENAMHSDDDQ